MMNSYALIENGSVVNVVLWDGNSDWAPPAGLAAVEITEGTMPGPGWSYTNGTFTMPASSAPVVPGSV